jgi:hypothetical protein
MYVGEVVEKDSSPRTFESPVPFVRVEVMDDDFVIQSDQFPQLAQAMKADIGGGLRAMLIQAVSPMRFEKNVTFPEGQVSGFVDAPVEIAD